MIIIAKIITAAVLILQTIMIIPITVLPTTVRMMITPLNMSIAVKGS